MEEFRSHFPDYRVLDKWFSPDWDNQTRERLQDIPPIRFFSAAEMVTLEAVIERILPQPERGAGEKVLIAPWIDEKLFLDMRDGYRYENMPTQRVAWRLGLAGIEQTAAILFNGDAFTVLDEQSQNAVLQRVCNGDAPGAIWDSLPAAVFFKNLLCAAVVHIYYAHPLAWNETGYNGPSSPRGHVRIRDSGVDPWEAQDSKNAPESAAAHGR